MKKIKWLTSKFRRHQALLGIRQGPLGRTWFGKRLHVGRRLEPMHRSESSDSNSFYCLQQ